MLYDSVAQFLDRVRCVPAGRAAAASPAGGPRNRASTRAAPERRTGRLCATGRTGRSDGAAAESAAPADKRGGADAAAADRPLASLAELA